MRRLNAFAYAVLVLLLVGLLGTLGCRDQGSSTSPTQVAPLPNFPAASAGGSVGGSAGGTNSAGGGANPTQCEVLDIQARRVLEVTPTSVTILVVVDYEGEGTPYVKFIDKATGEEVARSEEFGAITIDGLDPGRRYDWFVYVEVNEDGRIKQCDGGISFETPKLPPPPPSCVPEIDEYKKVDEGRWGECVPNEGRFGSGIRTRTITTYLYQSNSCKEEDELVETSVETERDECYIPPPCQTISHFKEHRHTSSDSWNNYFRGKCGDKGGTWTEAYYHSRGDRCSIPDGGTSSFWHDGVYFQFKGTSDQCAD